MAANPFVGNWKITSMDQWDQDFVDLVSPGFIRFEGGSGTFGFGAVRGEMDCKYATRDGEALVEWSWVGDDESEPTNGRGWARIDGERLVGHLYIHDGDDSGFEAERLLASTVRPPKRKSRS